MSTVAQLADRVYRDFLLPSDDQPVVVTLAGAVTADATSWVYDDATLAPDEEDLLAPGIIVECGTDQRRILAVDDTSNTITVSAAAVNGTTAAAHAAGAEVTAAPMFPRHSIIEAVKDNVATLYPSLWHVATAEVTTATDPVDVPAEVITTVEFLWQNGSRYQHGQALLLPNFPPSATGKAISLYGVPAGRTGYYTYRSKFARPATDTTDLATLGVDSTWERIVAVGAAAQVVAGRSQDALSAEYLTEQLEREALPPGTSTDLRNGLLTLRNVWLDEASRALRAEMSTPVVYRLALG